MNQEELKREVATAALDYVPTDAILGIGTGSTVNYFIDALKASKIQIRGLVASSKATAARLQSLGFPLIELNAIDELAVYIDSADACNMACQLVKGGGGALTGEKILSAMAKQFICMIDETKRVKVLGGFPVAIEVIPLARSFVAREIVKLGGQPAYRSGFVTDYGNVILDVHHWEILEAIKLEKALNDIAGVVSNGIFAMRPADLVLISTKTGMTVMGADKALMKKLLN